MYNKHNLLIWTSSFYPVLGGLQTATYEIAKQLFKKNWNVQVITNKYPRDLRSNESINQIRVSRFTFLSNPFDYFKTGRIDLLLAYLFFKPVTFIQLFIYFIMNKPKIVNLHFPDHQLFECLLLQKIFGFKLIVSLHGNEVERMKLLSKSSVKYSMYKLLFNMAESITGCSKYILNEFHLLFQEIELKKLIPVYNGVSDRMRIQKLNLHKGKYNFTVARLAPSKGINIIINVAEKLKTEKFVIAGFNKVSKLILTHIDNIDILGEIPLDSVAQYLTEAKLTVVPSVSESFGIVVAEALCCGSPVVATNVGGIPEVIALATEKLNEQEKHIFNSWVKLVNPLKESIIEGIEAINNNNSNIKDFINIIPKVRNQFSWENRMRHYKQILHGL